MTTQTRKEQIKEIEFQTKMLCNLKKWIRNLTVLSSIGIVFAYWALKMNHGGVFHLIGGAGILLAVLSVTGCIVIGLGYQKGKKNVNKIIKLTECRK